MTRRGFTILELMLVIAFMVLLAAMTIPSIEAMYGDVRLTAGADSVRGYWAEARTRAIEDGRPYRFSVTPGGGTFRIALFDDGTGTAMVDGDVKPLEVTAELPKGVLFAEQQGGTGGDDAGDGFSTIVVFRPDGTADRDVEIVFQSEGSRPLQLKLRGLTGSVTVQKLSVEK